MVSVFRTAAQRAIEGIANSVPRLNEWHFLTGAPGARARGPQSSVCHYTYVDNVGVLGVDPQEVVLARRAATSALDAVGLQTHELSEAALEDEAIAVFVHERHMLLRLSDQRFAKIRGTLRWSLARWRRTGRQLDIIVGHLTFAFLMRRPMLSIFCSCSPKSGPLSDINIAQPSGCSP